MAHARVRYELFFKDVAQLKTSLQSLRARGRAVTRVNLPNKDKGDDIVSWVDAVRECGETIDCVPHFSMKNNYERLDASGGAIEEVRERAAREENRSMSVGVRVGKSRERFGGDASKARDG